jgi:hypothetical protein
MLCPHCGVDSDKNVRFCIKLRQRHAGSYEDKV